jgi:hypothetical protein
LCVAYNGIVEELCLSRFLRKAHLMGNVLGDEQKADGLALSVAARRNHDARADPPPIFAQSSDDTFPLSVAEGGLHDFVRLPQRNVFWSMQNRGV